MSKQSKITEVGEKVYEQTLAGEEKMDRPRGITVVAVLFAFLAGLSLVWSALVFGVGALSTLVGGLFGAESIVAFGTSSGWSGLLGIVAAALQIAVAIGLLSMKKWAWILALIAVGVTVLQGIVGALGGGPFALMCGALGLVIPVAILIYLLQPRIRQAFGMRQE